MEKITKLFCIALLACSYSIPYFVDAATLRFSPSSSTKNVGSTFSVSLNVATDGVSVNAVSGAISFPRDILEIVSISKQGSIINLWVQEPTFSNTEGTAAFEGLVLNPGYKGNQGAIISITFRVKKEGEARVTFSSGSVLANDGLGTNVLETLGSATYSIQQATTPQATPTAQEARSNSSPTAIFSKTHADSTKWYANNSPEFTWSLPQGALEVRTLIGTSETAIPTVKYASPISSKVVDSLPDGTYFFSLQVRTQDGWGAISRYKVNIDTTPPKPFSVAFPHGLKGWDPQPVILFNTEDGESGVVRYEVKIGNGGPERIAPPATSNPYPLPPQYPGSHTVTVTAIDQAGNVRTASENFTIEAIQAPTITFYQEETEVGDLIKLRGITYPNADVTVYVYQKDELITEEPTRSNSIGDWALVLSKRLDPGTYSVTARVKDSRGAQSQETEKITVVVTSRFLADLTELFLNYLSLALLIVLGLAGLVAASGYAWYKSIHAVRRFSKETRDAEEVLQKSFSILRKDLRDHIAKMRAASAKRKLSKEEVAFLSRFEGELRDAESAIEEKIEKIPQKKSKSEE